MVSSHSLTPFLIGYLSRSLPCRAHQGHQGAVALLIIEIPLYPNLVTLLLGDRHITFEHFEIPPFFGLREFSLLSVAHYSCI